MRSPNLFGPDPLETTWGPSFVERRRKVDQSGASRTPDSTPMPVAEVNDKTYVLLDLTSSIEKAGRNPWDISRGRWFSHRQAPEKSRTPLSSNIPLYLRRFQYDTGAK